MPLPALAATGHHLEVAVTVAWLLWHRDPGSDVLADAACVPDGTGWCARCGAQLPPPWPADPDRIRRATRLHGLLAQVRRLRPVETVRPLLERL